MNLFWESEYERIWLGILMKGLRFKGEFEEELDGEFGWDKVCIFRAPFFDFLMEKIIAGIAIYNSLFINSVICEAYNVYIYFYIAQKF